MEIKRDCIVDVPGIKAGHWQDNDAKTGCTVVLCNQGAVCGVDSSGGAPGTRETDCLKPENLIEKVHAVLLTGGSAYGLAAADGVMRYCEERDIGFDVQVAKVPIVPAAVLFDLSVGNPKVRPTPQSGYDACMAASENILQNGSFGAGCGATVGKALGLQYAMAGGVGSASITLPNGVVVGAVVAVNAVGDIVQNGKIIAGAQQNGKFMNIASHLLSKGTSNIQSGNTCIGVVATNARLDKALCKRLSSTAHDALAQTAIPCHTLYDGDTFFALSTGDIPIDFTALQVAAMDVVRRAIWRSVGRE